MGTVSQGTGLHPGGALEHLPCRPLRVVSSREPQLPRSVRNRVAHRPALRRGPLAPERMASPSCLPSLNRQSPPTTSPTRVVPSLGRPLRTHATSSRMSPRNPWPLPYLPPPQSPLPWLPQGGLSSVHRVPPQRCLLPRPLPGASLSSSRPTPRPSSPRLPGRLLPCRCPSPPPSVHQRLSSFLAALRGSAYPCAHVSRPVPQLLPLAAPAVFHCSSRCLRPPLCSHVLTACQPSAILYLPHRYHPPLFYLLYPASPTVPRPSPVPL